MLLGGCAMPAGNHGYSGPGAYNADGTKVGDPAATPPPGAQATLTPPAPQPAPQPIPLAPQPAPRPAYTGPVSNTAGVGAESCVRIVYAELAMARGVEVWPTDEQMHALVSTGLANPTPQQLQVFQACLIHWPQVHGELVAYQAASPAEQHLKARAAVQVLVGLGLLRAITTCPGLDAVDCTVLSVRPAVTPAPEPMPVAEGPPVEWKDDRPTKTKKRKPKAAPAPAPAPVVVSPAPTPKDDVLPGLQDLLRQSNRQMQQVGAH